MLIEVFFENAKNVTKIVVLVLVLAMVIMMLVVVVQSRAMLVR